MQEQISEYERERQAKLDKLRQLGVDPYGQRAQGIQPLARIKSSYKAEMGHDGGPVVKGAGRIILKRDMGKLSFITLRDESGDLQVGLDKKRLSDPDWQVRDLLDLGDQIVVEGPLGTTNKGETTIWAKSLAIASKALLPPPAKWEGLGDVELRYRQRYVDLWANPEVMKMMQTRIRVIDEVRAFLKGRGFLEVETPMMQIIHGGAAARPFKTHHNALDVDLYMRIAPELYLKRLLVGGFTKVFELNRNFRNEGISPRHNPEFTMLEAYEAYGSWETMAEMVESMICHVAQKVFGTLKIEHKNLDGSIRRTINLEGDTSLPPGRRWKRVEMTQLVREWTTNKFGYEYRWPNGKQSLNEASNTHVRERLIDWAVSHLPENAGPRNIDRAKDAERLRFERLSSFFEQLQDVYERWVEPLQVDPVFVTRVPGIIIPLAKRTEDDEDFADVYELAINGVEISPGYSELNDPQVQAAHFAHQVGDKEEQQKTDEDFLTALKYGMPPAGGMGMGIDRLLMMLTGAESIRDVILFPLMRPQD
ncbi:MAG TPA: lysine--tRNA ligase [Tepidisphaeraceae bacterium]|nr:lysine--tRNA ligase [Tepidisphaeraceae bacterium]